MAQITLRDWLALLSEGGVKFSSANGLRATVEAAARRLDVPLEPADLVTLDDLANALTPLPAPQPGFLPMTVSHIPQLEDVPSAAPKPGFPPITSRHIPQLEIAPLPAPNPGMPPITTRHIPQLQDTPSPAPNPGVPPITIRHIPQLNDVPPAPGGDVPAPGPSGPTTLPTLPPWGRMEEKLEALLQSNIVPIDWTPSDGAQATLEKWETWRADLVIGIDSMLWPVYNKTGTSGSVLPVAQLLDADFRLLFDLHQNIARPIKARYPATVTHNDLFKEEDDPSVAFGSGYDRYDPTLPAHCLSDLPTVLIAGMAHKVATLDLQLKQFFQRPRPYQVALLQNRSNFGYLWARTGNTPSLVSGHCLQVSVAGCTAYVAYAQELEERSIDILKQYTVDVGDRRVFAGIHYPSDSLASWYVALNLVPLVFDGEDAAAARHFLWSSISTKSAVFAAVRAHADSNGSSPYQKIVDEITRLGSSDR
jgi:hypothetical protein